MLRLRSHGTLIFICFSTYCVVWQRLSPGGWCLVSHAVCFLPTFHQCERSESVPRFWSTLTFSGSKYSELPSKACFVAKSVAFGHISVRSHYSCHIEVFTCAAFLAGRSTFLAGKLPAGQADVCQCFSSCMILFVLLWGLCQMHAASDYWLAWCAFCWRCYLTLRSCILVAVYAVQMLCNLPSCSLWLC